MSNKQIKVRINVFRGNIVTALSLFKRKMLDSEHLNLYKDKQYYTKPTTAKRKKKQQAIRNNKRNLENNGR